MYQYRWTSHALHQLKKLSPDVQRIIIKKLDYFITTSNPLDFSSTLKDSILGSYRFRIGDYRVIFDVDQEEKTIIILILGHRREIYK